MQHTLTLLLLLVLCTCARAQRTVTGSVIDDNKDPIIGATVLINGTSNGTVTDFEGKFSIVGPNEAFTLLVSFVGYESLEHEVDTTDNSVTLVLLSGPILDEIVVVGYRRSLKRSITGAVSGLFRGSGRNKSRRSADPIKPGSYNPITPNSFISTKVEPISTLSTDVDRAAYANIRSFLNRGQLPPKDAVRIEEMVNYFPYARPEFGPDDPIRLGTEIITCPWRPGALLLRVTAETAPYYAAEKAHELLPSEQASNLVFLVDVSGSMNGPGRLSLVKESLRMLSRQLSAYDRVSLLTYAGRAGLVLPPTAGNDTTTIFAALNRLQAGGSTAGGSGIKLAYQTAREALLKGGNNRVIIATDGDFNVGISSQDELVKLIEKERESGVFLTVLGFGRGNYQDGMMQELADRGNGNHAFIDQPEEARKVLVEEFGGTIHTVAKDVKLQLHFDPDFIKAYRLIGYENRLLNTEDFDDDTKDAAELGAGHQVTVLYEIVPTKSYAKANYLGYLKLRYKPAAGGRSAKLSVPIAADALPDELASPEIQWAAAVATFGMLLRDSAHKGNANYSELIGAARKCIGEDPGGYRREMIGLLEKAAALTSKR